MLCLHGTSCSKCWLVLHEEDVLCIRCHAHVPLCTQKQPFKSERVERKGREYRDDQRNTARPNALQVPICHFVRQLAYWCKESCRLGGPLLQ